MASSPADLRTLEVLAGRSGFGFVQKTTDGPAAAAEPAAITYFLLHYHLSDAAMRQVLAHVRADAALRYSPVILIIDDCPVEVLLKYIDLGFDDVISLPEKREVLEARLANQLNAEHVYFQTADYLGPDRRRMELPGHTDARRQGRNPFVRMVIWRDPASGAAVRHRQVIGHAAGQPPDARLAPVKPLFAM